MKKVLDFIKNFKYKTVVAVVLVILTQLLYRFAEIKIFGVISMACFLYLVFTVYRLMYHAVLNTYKQNKTLAYVFAGIIIVFTSFLIYLIISTGVLFS